MARLRLILGRSRRWFAAVMAGVCLSAVTWLIVRALDTRPQLDRARAALKTLAWDASSTRWLEQLGTVEADLQAAAGGRRAVAAQLLLSAVQAAMGVRRPIQPPAQGDWNACTGDDLVTAAVLFSRAGQTARADELVEVGLRQPAVEPERVLRGATALRYQLGRDRDVDTLGHEWAKLAPLDPEPWEYLAFVAEDRGFWEDAVHLRREQLRRTPSVPDELRRTCVDLLLRVGQSRDAREELEKLHERETPVARLLEARLLVLEGRPEVALPLLDEILAADRQSEAAAVLKARILLSQGDARAALAILQPLRPLHPTSADLRYVLGQALARAGDAAAARVELDASRQLLDARVRINALERRAGQFPKDAQVRRQLAALYETLDQREQAQFWRRAAAALEARQ